MNDRTPLTWRARRCHWQVVNGHPGPYGYCQSPVTVERYDRGWCEAHDPDRVALEIAFAMLIQVTRRAA